MSALHVVHDIPGRVRLRLGPGAASDGLTAAIAAEPGVTHCAWSPRTRSLLVLYDREHADRTAIVGAVARATGLEQPADTNGSTAPSTPSQPGSLLISGVRETVGEIDQRVQRVTRGLLGLSTLMPVALVTWSIAQIVRGRATPLSWTSALWYAHGLSRDYHEPVTRD